jgi:hypothetical protein
LRHPTAGQDMVAFNRTSSPRIYMNESSGGNLRFNVALSSDAAFTSWYNTANTLAAQIRATGDSYLTGGKLGIGTNAPASTLHVHGTVTINAGVTNSIDMLDTNGTTRTKIYSQGGTLYSSASPSSRTVSDDEWQVMNGTKTTTGIDGKSIANTTLYTVPTGRQLIVERIIIIPTTTAAVVTPPTVSIGKTGAGYIDVVAAGALTGLTATLTSATLAPIVGASVIDSGESLVLRVSSGASATSYTFKAVVIGTLL